MNYGGSYTVPLNNVELSIARYELVYHCLPRLKACMVFINSINYHYYRVRRIVQEWEVFVATIQIR